MNIKDYIISKKYEIDSLYNINISNDLVDKFISYYDDKELNDVKNEIDIRIDNYCGWPASSLIPIMTTDNIQIYNPVVAGYNSDTWDTVALYFEINSPLYKVLTGESYSTFVKG